MRPGQGDRQLDQPQGGRGEVPRAGAADPALRRRRRRDGVRRGGAGGHGRAQGRDLRPRLRPPRRGRLAAGGHRLRPERARGRDGNRGAQRLREGVHRGAAAAEGALSGLAHERRHLQSLLRLPRQRRRPRGDALRVPLRRDPRGAGHGDRQRRPARRLRGHPARPPRARPRRALRPAAGCDGPACLVRIDGPGLGDEARARPLLARGAGGEAARARARARDRRLHRGRHRGGARGVGPPARRDRRPVDGRDEGRRRPLRLRPDVPAAGGQERAGDETRGGVPRAVHGGGEGADRAATVAPRARSSWPRSRGTCTTSARTSSASSSAATTTR